MTPELRLMMLSWRDAPPGDDATEGRRRHAIYRLSVESDALQFPPLIAQAASALSAAGSAITAALAGQPVLVDQAEQDRRLAICRTCEHYDPCQARCVQCGCFAGLKTRLATAHCPLPEPRW